MNVDVRNVPDVSNNIQETDTLYALSASVNQFGRMNIQTLVSFVLDNMTFEIEDGKLYYVYND